MIELRLPLAPSTNNLYVNIPGKGRVKSARYQAWLRSAGTELKLQRPEKITGDYALWLYCQRPDKGRRDISNFVKAVEDLLVAHQVVEDDSLCYEMHLFWDTDKGRRCLVQVVAKLTLQQIFGQPARAPVETAPLFAEAAG